MSYNVNRLHVLIGDYKRLIDKVDQDLKSTKKVSSKALLKRKNTILNKIKDTTIKLQKMDW